MKIKGDIEKRRNILRALDYVTRTNFLIFASKAKEDLALIMNDKSLLVNDLIRLAPINFRESNHLPLTSLEDIVTLFDAAETDSYLP